jgi:hypothetical protein
MTDNLSSNSSKKFGCEKCDYYTCRKSQYDRHILSAKHKKTDSLLTNTDIKCSESSIIIFFCECGKQYKHRQSLFNHKKKCIHISDSESKTEINNQQPTNELVLTLLNQNMELQKQIIELCKEKNTVINNNTTNNNFNLNFFLNEKCKDALNIMDFINQLQLKLSDLDMVGRIGYVEGISKIFIRGLKELDVFKRPIHCSDFKREVLYVKDKDSWEKDNEEKKKLKTAIKFIAAKNFKQLNDWKEENPDSDDYDSKKHMEYHNIIIKAAGGSNNEEDDKNFNKIIKNVAKEVTIDKVQK